MLGAKDFIDLFVKVMEKLHLLADADEKNRRKVYEDFVRPAMSDFEALHASYLARFDKYEEMVTKSQHIDGNHPVLKLIEKDRRAASALKSRVERLARLEDLPEIALLVRSMRFYFISMLRLDVDHLEMRSFWNSNTEREFELSREAYVARKPLPPTGKQYIFGSPATYVHQSLTDIFERGFRDEDGFPATDEIDPRTTKITLAKRLFDHVRTELDRAYRRVGVMELETRKRLLRG
jgi:hypothetical protein